MINLCRKFARCCKELVTPRFWETTKGLTVEQKNWLREERKKYPKGEKGACEMVVDEDGQTSCLVQKHFNIKPSECWSHPINGECLNCKNYEHCIQSKSNR